MNSEPIIPDPSLLLQLGFYVFALAMAISLPIASYKATGDKRILAVTSAITPLWMAFTGGLTLWPGFRVFEPPPPFLLTVLLGLGGVTTLVCSSMGKRIIDGLSLAGLVLFQSFRLPLEVLMHRAYQEGLMPVQMSYEGRNFDIISGLTAFMLGLYLLYRPAPKSLVWLWNISGLALLLNIVTVAFLSAPSPWRIFMNDPPNVWILDVPFVWLPMVMVMAAFFGHFAVARKLLMEPATQS